MLSMARFLQVNAKTLLTTAALTVALMGAGGCSSSLKFQRSPAGTVAADLERAGANYQATEAEPGFRRDRPSGSEPAR